VEALDVVVGHHERAPVAREAKARLDQPAAEEHRVVARVRVGPDEAHRPPGAHLLAQREQRGQRTAHELSPAGGNHRVGGAVVDLLTLAVELVEAAAVARERPPLPRGPAPGVLGAHLEVDHHVGLERPPHPLRSERPTAQGHHLGVLSLQQAARHVLFARAEGVLALAREERLERLAQLALELAVRVERLGPELRRQGADGGGLPRPHEADEDERRSPGQRLHPIRSS
jgi:hypothetical protein